MPRVGLSRSRTYPSRVSAAAYAPPDAADDLDTDDACLEQASSYRGQILTVVSVRPGRLRPARTRSLGLGQDPTPESPPQVVTVPMRSVQLILRSRGRAGIGVAAFDRQFASDRR